MLLPEGGKHPDFAVAFRSDGLCFLVDVKLHATDGLETFSLDPREIAEFWLGMRQLGIDVLLIALIPRESVDRLFLIALDDIEQSNEWGAAGVFKLIADDTIRLFGPLARKSYDLALDRYRAEGFTGEVPPYPDRSGE